MSRKSLYLLKRRWESIPATDQVLCSGESVVSLSFLTFHCKEICGDLTVLIGVLCIQ